VQKVLAGRSRRSERAIVGAIGAVFGSWMAHARAPIGASTISRGLGHGGQRPGDGVRQIAGRRRRPASPLRAIPRPASARCTAEFLINAQGEDVVAAIRTPAIDYETGRESMRARNAHRWKEAMPEAFAELKRIAGALEAHYRDMQDVEFTRAGRQALHADRRAARSDGRKRR